MFSGSQQLQAPFVGTGFNDLDRDVPNPPSAHFVGRGHVEIDGRGTDQRRAIIVDNISLVGSGDLELGAQRKARPISRRAAFRPGFEPGILRILRQRAARVRIRGGSDHLGAFQLVS